MKQALFLSWLTTMIFHGYAQSVFTYDVKKDIAVGSLALGVSAASFFVENKPANAPGVLDKKMVNSFDRSLLFPYHRTLDKASDWGVYGLLALPALSVMKNINDGDALLSYGVMYAEAALLTYGTVHLLKNALIRYRPYMYSGGVPAGKEDDYYDSFPSGSTAMAFLAAGFLTATFTAEYPDSPWKIPLAGGAYVLAGGIAAGRIVSGSHFLSDVITGAAIASLYGYVIPALHKRQSNEAALRITGNEITVSLKF
ncbi:MAG: phosphatase PAP2 family protein [Treponema sp.]|jgi:membrane-associated phospholipid phosphatase|nr:phosphatase PAP2 family protein [Treponema sp.]